MVKIFDDKDLQGILSNLHRWSSFDDLGSIKFDFNKICLVWQSQTASGQSQKILIPSSALYLTLKSSMCVTFVISQKNFWFFHILNSFEHQSQFFFTFRNYSKQESMSQRGILEIVDNAFNHHATEQITSEIHLLWEIPINFCYLVCVRQRVLHLLGKKNCLLTGIIKPQHIHLTGIFGVFDIEFHELFFPLNPSKIDVDGGRKTWENFLYRPLSFCYCDVNAVNQQFLFLTVCRNVKNIVISGIINFS